MRDAILADIHFREGGIDEMLFSRALHLAGCTAWVVCNDGFAINALTFLRAKGIRAPLVER